LEDEPKELKGDGLAGRKVEVAYEKRSQLTREGEKVVELLLVAEDLPDLAEGDLPTSLSLEFALRGLHADAWQDLAGRWVGWGCLSSRVGRRVAH
jgi:hypothetical protein